MPTAHVPAAQSLQSGRAKSVSCFSKYGYVLLGRDPAWRPDPAAPAEEQASAIAALLPAWIPLPDAADSDLGTVKNAEDPSAGSDTAAAQQETPQILGQSAREGDQAAAGPDRQSGQGDEKSPGAAGDQKAPPVTFEDAAEPAGPEPADAAGLSRGCHVVLAAPLWPRLCELDPELPEELARAKATLHLVAESRVSLFHCAYCLPTRCALPNNGLAHISGASCVLSRVHLQLHDCAEHERRVWSVSSWEALNTGVDVWAGTKVAVGRRRSARHHGLSAD